MVGAALVEVPRRPIAELGDVIGVERTARLIEAATRYRRLANGRVVWTVSSTATGGGVAEMLAALVGYTKDLAIDVRWYVVEGDPEFFRITKRLHNWVHGELGDGGGLGPAQRNHLDQVLGATADALGPQVHPGDVVLLHDPQTAGLAGPLARRGAQVIWRSHIGIDGENDLSRAAWEFLRAWLADAHAYVFSRRSYVPAFLPPERTRVIPPSIDPFSPKNQVLDPAQVRAILARMGVLSGATATGHPAATPPPAPPPPDAYRFVRRDGAPGVVSRPAMVAAEALPGPDEPVVVQVSRWDRLKDMVGVMRGFAEHVAPYGPGWLVLAGPAVEAITDDPEGAVVFAECLSQWRRLPPASRSRVVLATLPMADVDENGAMVNALQRHASVVTQKSLEEGFGLTVAEAMWKGRPVVGSAVGGIQDQIIEGTGILLPNPTNLAEFGRAVRRLLDQPELAQRLGEAAHEHVRRRYVGDVHLLRYAELLTALVTQTAG